MNAAVLIISALALGGYYCRLDALLWQRHGRLAILMHMAGAIASAWAVIQALTGAAGRDELALALLAAGWIAASYREWSAGVPAWAHSVTERWRSHAGRDATAPARIHAEAPASPSPRAPGEL